MILTAAAPSTSPNSPDDLRLEQHDLTGTHLTTPAAPLLDPLIKSGSTAGIGTSDHLDFQQRARGVSFVTTLPLRLDVKIPMPNFRFKDLSNLRAGQVLATAWPVSEDLPVAAGDVRLLWAEFSVAERQLTVRVTRVA